MGCYLSFRGSLEIRPPISEEDKEQFHFFSEEMSFPTNPKANYMSPWFITPVISELDPEQYGGLFSK